MNLYTEKRISTIICCTKINARKFKKYAKCYRNKKYMCIFVNEINIQVNLYLCR